LSERELDYYYRVVDQTISMHASLRDRYASWASLTDISLMALSGALVAMSLIDPARLSPSITQPCARAIMVAISFLVFVLSMVTWRVDWKAKASHHDLAIDRLAKVKALCRSLKYEESPTPERITEVCKACAEALAAPPRIPERDFARLKAAHLVKVEVSSLLSDCPGSSIQLVRAALWVRGNLGVLRRVFFAKEAQQ